MLMSTIKVSTLIIVLICNVFTSCFAESDTPDIKITLTQNNKLEWRVRYDFKEPQSSMFFWRSLGDYRTSTWTALSKDTHIDRFNGLDSIWFNEPRKTAEFSLTPYSAGIRSDYTPFLKFSDGGFAVYTGQFEVALTSSIEDIKALDGQSETWNESALSKEIELRSPLKIITDGKVNNNFVNSDFRNGGIYIYVGNDKISQNEHYIGVIDEKMPIWVRDKFTDSLPLIFKKLSELYQHQRDQKIELFYAFKGTEKSGFSNGGGTIGENSLVLESSGALFLNENPRVIQRIHKTLAHEGAHLFQHSKANPVSKTDYWIHEGGAEVATIFVLSQAKLISNKELITEIENAFSICADYIKKNKLSNSIKNRSSAHYHCGQLIGYMTDAALKDHTYFEFWAELLETAKLTQQGKHYSSTTYFDTMLALNADESIVTSLKKMTQQTIENPKEFISGLMIRSGLKVTFNEQFELSEFKLP